MMKNKLLSIVKVAFAAFFFACAPAMAQWQVPDNAVPIGRGSPNQGFKNVPLPSGSLLIGQAGIPLAIVPTGDVTINAAGVTTIGATKVTNSMLTGSIAASKLIGTDIGTVGTITTGVWNGTTIALANGGTGATTAPNARTNLGLVIGTNVQAWDADLDAFALKTAPTGAVVGTTDTQTLTGKTVNCANNTCTVRLPNDVTGILPAANHPALTGDVTSVAGALATTLATVNSNVGSFGGVSAVPNFTVNAKGLITAAGSAAYQDGTNAQKGVVRGDGTTITCAAGVCTSVGSAATSIAVGTTTISGGTSGDNLYNNGGVLGSRAVVNPTIQIFTSGSGTYTTPAGVRYIRVRGVAGGSGGNPSGTNASPGGAPTAGGATTFGSSLLSASGGGAPTVGAGSQPGGLGGTATIAGGAISLGVSAGSDGGAGFNQAGSTNDFGGAAGGASCMGGAGGGGGANQAGRAAKAGTGSGGGGGGIGAIAGSQSGAGGAGGGCFYAQINSPSATYAYAVGAAGSGGTAGGSGAAGGNGSAGWIVVEEFYQ